MYNKNRREELQREQSAYERAIALESDINRIEHGLHPDYVKRLRIADKGALEELRLICETQSTIKTSKLKVYLERLENGD